MTLHEFLLVPVHQQVQFLVFFVHQRDYSHELRIRGLATRVSRVARLYGMLARALVQQGISLDG